MSKPWSFDPTLKLYLKLLCIRRNYQFIIAVSDSTRCHFYRLISLSSDGTWPKCRNYFVILCLQVSKQNVKGWVSFSKLRKVKYIWMMVMQLPPLNHQSSKSLKIYPLLNGYNNGSLKDSNYYIFVIYFKIWTKIELTLPHRNLQVF